MQPTRLTSQSKTLVDNLLSNILSTDIISGNLTATISDHLPLVHLPLIFFQTLLTIDQIFLKWRLVKIEY